MAVTNNINGICDIYRRWQPFGHPGAPGPGQDRPSSVMPLDRVTLSEQAFKEDSRNPDAALAPAQPSGTDRAVAARASQIEALARMERTPKGPGGEDDKNQTTDSASSMTGAVTDPTACQSIREACGRQIDLII